MLKAAYPAIITQTAEAFTVEAPQFRILEKAETQAEAIQKARENICSHIALCEDTRKEVPLPAADLTAGPDPSSRLILIDIDMGDYRRRHDARAVRKNCTIPQWLDAEARRRNINFSQVLQNALLTQLGIN